MRPVFRERYPHQLQQVIDHADRFRGLIRERGATTDAVAPEGRGWLTGRAEEVETVIGSMVVDWESGHLSERAAVVAISAYLGALHVGADRYLKTGPEAPCCQSDVASTLPQRPWGSDLETADTLVDERQVHGGGSPGRG